MLGEGALLPAGDQFVIDDSTRVEAILAEDDGADGDDSADIEGVPAEGDDSNTDIVDASEHDDVSGWTSADKLAGVIALCLMGGYQMPVIRDAVAGTVDVALGSIVGTVPFPALVFGLAVVVAVTSTGVRRYLGGDGASGTDELRERMESLREDLRAAREREDEAAIERLEAEQREAMTEEFVGLKLQFRPLVWAMLLTIPVFMWLTLLTVDPIGAIASASTFNPRLRRDRLDRSGRRPGAGVDPLVWAVLAPRKRSDATDDRPAERRYRGLSVRYNDLSSVEKSIQRRNDRFYRGAEFSGEVL